MAERVLITGARAASALDLARDFAAAGWRVHMADSSPARVARWSRVPAAVHRYAPPAREPARFRADVAALVRQIDPALVLPACEEVFHLAAPALQGVLDGRLFAPPLAMLRALHDKLAFAEIVAAAGLTVPETHLLPHVAAVHALAGQSADWVFKPRFSRFGEAALVGPCAGDLAEIYPTPGHQWIAQARVLGNEASFYAVARHGRVVAFAAYHSEWRLGGGASFAFHPLHGELADRLRAMADGLAAHLSLTGQFACDVMIDDAGQPWLIECNPRATSGVHLLAGEGQLARAVASGEPCPPPHEARPAHLSPAMLVYGLPLALRRGRMAHWRRDLRDGACVLSRRGDRWPLLGALVDTVGFRLTGWRHGVSTTAATTRDIEWNGEELD